jgi:7-cyano-7-deazaguanine reductase
MGRRRGGHHAVLFLAGPDLLGQRVEALVGAERAWHRPPVPSQPSKQLETFPNPRIGRAYEIRFECPEFTCLCPKTGQPDFATIRIRYVPRARCVELKSLKLYLWSFRDGGHFHEQVTNQILDDLVAATEPASMEVEGDFMVRGGIHTVVVVRHDAESSAA